MLIHITKKVNITNIQSSVEIDENKVIQWENGLRRLTEKKI